MINNWRPCVTFLLPSDVATSLWHSKSSLLATRSIGAGWLPFTRLITFFIFDISWKIVSNGISHFILIIVKSIMRIKMVENNLYWLIFIQNLKKILWICIRVQNILTCRKKQKRAQISRLCLNLLEMFGDLLMNT